ncbi:hypothetical protein [Halolamina salina]
MGVERGDGLFLAVGVGPRHVSRERGVLACVDLARVEAHRVVGLVVRLRRLGEDGPELLGERLDVPVVVDVVELAHVGHVVLGHAELRAP